MRTKSMKNKPNKFNNKQYLTFSYYMPNFFQHENNLIVNVNKLNYLMRLILTSSKNLHYNVEKMKRIDNRLKSMYNDTKITSESNETFLYFSLFDLYEKTRKQYYDIEQEYNTFRIKQYSSHFISKQLKSSKQPSACSTPISNNRKRSNSFSLLSIPDLNNMNSSPSTNLFETSSASLFKSHINKLKSRIKSLTNDCTKINDQLRQSEHDNRSLLDHITTLERQHRDDCDSLQSELNNYRKLVEKYSNENSPTVLLNLYSPPENDLSLYDEVLLENDRFNSLYQPTNYKELFARVYETLKMNIKC